jgi:hypothetical protein
MSGQTALCEGFRGIGFGECRGTVIPARDRSMK